jgi:hypothetical protein
MPSHTTPRDLLADRFLHAPRARCEVMPRRQCQHRGMLQALLLSRRSDCDCVYQFNMYRIVVSLVDKYNVPTRLLVHCPLQMLQLVRLIESSLLELVHLPCESVPLTLASIQGSLSHTHLKHISMQAQSHEQHFQCSRCPNELPT